MRDLVRLIVRAVVDLFRSRAAIEAEILTLRQQIIVLRRTAAKDAPFSRAVERAGQILCRPILGGLHHQYARI
jgi:hypothetical protein